ncbi:hypothetical protein CBL_05031 [Carabus blaptoides fortunei]
MSFWLQLRPSVECPSLSTSDLIPLLKTIEEAACSSAVMRIVEPFASAMSSTRWGTMHEDVAVKKYQSVVASKHASLQIKQVGFVIDNLYPAIGASPDRVVCYECCNSGCVEVKCPYLLRENNVTIKDFANMKNTCLVVIEDKIQLDRKHANYYQVQLQMLTTKIMYCDFVVWSPIEIYIERIIKEEEFLGNSIKLEVALNFHKKVILPELLGKCFTRKNSNAVGRTLCLCQGYEDGRAMVKCNNETCSAQRYHLDCK